MTFLDVVAHLREYQVAYLVGLVVFAIIIWFTRRHTLPVLFWCLEILLYAGLFHVFVHYFVVVINWFNYSTQMEALQERRIDQGWTTPLVEFWRRELYNPRWIVYVEIVAFIAIAALIFRVRPYKTQKIKPKPPKKPGQPGYRPPAARQRR